MAAQSREILVPHLSTYQFEVLLCNYRQTLTKTYVGRHHDSELEQYTKVRNWFGMEHMMMFDFLRKRKDIFPPECLGELNGWTDKRKELNTVFADHGYFWSDLRFDYSKTTDLANPVARS